MKLDPGIGTCGKGGQWVPVGVGQPSILVDQITVGGHSFFSLFDHQDQVYKLLYCLIQAIRFLLLF